MSKSVIVIPARYNSSRFPGKPLAMIAGQTMLSRVVGIANTAAEQVMGTDVLVATDDQRIEQHAHELGVKVVMTPADCQTGSDRALAACQQLEEQPDFIVNLQGDAPLTPASFVVEILKTLQQDDNVDVATPVVQLAWDELDLLRARKQQVPFSGTTAVVDKEGYALWFSKQIIPAIRKEAKYREQGILSPVFRHVGLYGYRFESLQKFVSLPEGHYEALEGLEQLRLLENKMTIKTVAVSYGNLPNFVGVDTVEDAQKTEELLLAMES